MASSSTNLTASLLSVEVIEHYLQDDASYYQNHIFIIQVFLEQNEFRIYRSYAAFCELDHKLRRQYPRSTLPALPLAGASAFQKKAGKRFSILSSSDKAGGNSTVNSLSGIDVRDSMIAPSSLEKSNPQKRLVKRIENQEVIPNRRLFLTHYLNDLLKIPEVVVSDTFHIFLDEESPVDDLPNHLNEYSDEAMAALEINLLLQDEAPNSKSISKELVVPLTVSTGYVVAWSFETKQHDIGFSITFDSQEVVAYQRVNSHEKACRGIFEAPSSGQLMIIWDNSYSKWRKKVITYMIRVVDQEMFRAISEQSAALRREKVIKHKQRVHMKKVLMKIGTEVSHLSVQQRMQHQADDVNGSVGDPKDGRLESSSLSLHDRSALRIIEEENEDEEADSEPNRYTLSEAGNLRDSILLAPKPTVNTSAHNKPTRQSLLHTSTDQEITISLLTQQVDSLKQEKKYLQTALSEAETALLQERSACASNVQQVEDITMTQEMLEEEVQILREENDNLRKELHEAVQDKIQRSARFVGSSATNSSGNIVEVSNEEQEVLRNLAALTVEEFIFHYQPIDNGNHGNNAVAEHVREVLALHHFDALVHYTRSLVLNQRKLSEQIVAQEAQVTKQKQNVKQLRAGLLQLKEKHDLLVQTAAHGEHEKLLVIGENETLQAKLRSCENQVRILNKELTEVNAAYGRLYQAEQDRLEHQRQLQQQYQSHATGGNDDSSLNNDEWSNRAPDASKETCLPAPDALLSASSSLIMSRIQNGQIEEEPMDEAARAAAAIRDTGSDDEEKDVTEKKRPPSQPNEVDDDEGDTERREDDTRRRQLTEQKQRQWQQLQNDQQRLVRHDFAQVEADELSQYLNQMTTSFMAMLGVDEGDGLQSGGSGSRFAPMLRPDQQRTPAVIEEELQPLKSSNSSFSTSTTSGSAAGGSFSRSPTSGSHGSFSASPNPLSSTRSIFGGASNSNNGNSSKAASSSTSSSWTSSFKQMSFGF